MRRESSIVKRTKNISGIKSSGAGEGGVRAVVFFMCFVIVTGLVQIEVNFG